MAHQAGAYPGFSSMKHLGVFLLPPGWDASLAQGYPRHCNFGTSLDDSLRDQLNEKLTDFELKRKLLEQRNITLEEALDKARAWEAAGRQATNITVNPAIMEGERCQCSQDGTKKRR